MSYLGIINNVEFLQERAAPAVSEASQATVYADSTSHTLKVSLNGGAYSDFITGATASLQGAYNNGATIVESGGVPVAISSTTADNGNVLTVTKNPAGAQSGIGVSVAMGATTTGSAIMVNQTTGGSGLLLQLQNNAVNQFTVSNAGLVVSGTYQAGAGTAAAPTHTFTGDTTTGLFDSAVGTLGFTTAGVSRATLSSAAFTTTVPQIANAGTAAAPTHTFTGDTTTGLFDSAVGTLGFATAGVSRATLAAAALVTTVPLRPLAGTAAAPSHSFSASTNDGMFDVAAGTLGFSTSGTIKLQLTGSTLTHTPSATAAGVINTIVSTAAAHTNQTLSTEVLDWNFNGSAILQHATGALATQRSFIVQPRTYSFVAASTITTAATVAITGAPIAGANATITNAFALDVTGATRITGKLTVTGSIDPTDLSLSGGTALFFASTDGSTAPISAVGSGRIRYNNGTTSWEQSVNGGAYGTFGAAALSAVLAVGNTTGGNPIIVSAGDSIRGVDSGAPSALTLRGGNATVATIAGANASLTAGSGNTTGNGGNVSVTGGVGGVVGPAVGGTASLTGGAAGVATLNGGAVSVFGGAGLGNAPSVGGACSISGGDAQAATTGAGGNLTLSGGAGGTANPGGTGGNVVLVGGSGSSVTGAGNVTIAGGSSLVSGAPAGTLLLRSGSCALAGSSQGSGNVTIRTGDINAGSANAGSILITGGAQAGSSGNGTSISLTCTAGVGAGTPLGGTLALTAGASLAAGTGGAITGVAGQSVSGTAGPVTFTAGAGGSTSGAGGIASLIGGAGTAGNAAGGVSKIVAGAGQGTAAGGAAQVTGGVGGATGAGGGAVIAAGAGGATSGVGGASSMTGGAGTAGNSAGGSSSVVGGAGQGSATGGAAQLTGGAGGATGAGAVTTVAGGVGGATSGSGGNTVLAGGAGGAAASAGGEIVFQTAKAGAGTTLVERYRTTSDGSEDWTGIVTASAPALSAASHGRIYYDSTSQVFMVSANGGAYAALTGGAATLAQVLVAGNVTGGTSIVTSSGDLIRGVDGNPPGALLLRGGNSTAGTNVGGAVTITGGTGSGGTASGGVVTITGGTGSATAAGAAVSINGGAGGGTSGSGGGLDITAGNATAGVSAGGALNITAGYAKNGGTAGNLNLSAGAGGTTGSDTGIPGSVVISGGLALVSNQTNGGDITIRTYSNNNSSTAITRYKCVAGQVGLTSGSAATIFQVPLAASEMIGGFIHFSACATDGTDFQNKSGFATFSAVNKAGTFTTSITIQGTPDTATSTGSITVAFSITTGGSTLSIQTTVTSSGITPTKVFMEFQYGVN